MITTRSYRASFQDADLEMSALTESANHEARLKAKGICAHGAAITYEHAVVCSGCGKHFETWQELAEERSEILA